jgi:hypothetical protein
MLNPKSARTKMQVQTRPAGRCSTRRRVKEGEKRRSVQMMRGVSAPQTYQRGKEASRLLAEMPCEPLTEKNRPTAVQRQNPRKSLTSKTHFPASAGM